uniref:Uncharacterized protein n=1 Tax=Pelagomonas calceolata TaxID=35677 RepID=A0A7S4E5Z5_9STRA
MDQPHKVRALKSVTAASYTTCATAALLGRPPSSGASPRRSAQSRSISYTTQKKQDPTSGMSSGSVTVAGKYAGGSPRARISKCFCERRMCAALKRHGSRMDLLVTRSSAKPKKRGRPVSP